MSYHRLSTNSPSFSKRTTSIDLLRHGEPVGGRRYRGQTDDPLSDKGWHEMRQATQCNPSWSHIIASPLKRCAAFAEELAAQRGLPLTLDARLMEIGFGEWEGRTPAELEADDPQRLIRFWSDPEAHTPPGAEPIGQFSSRIQAVWQEILHRHAGEHVLLVAHAGVIRMIIAHVLGAPARNAFRIQVPSSGITRLRIDQNGAYTLPRLLSHGGILSS